MKHPGWSNALIAGLLALALCGCGRSATTIEEAPFREAVARYVKANNMAMKLKEIKEAPTADGDTAKMTASMTHEQLGGPSVTWTFEFARQSDGSWQVVKHQD